MKVFIKIALVIVTSLFFFPFEFTFLPSGLNTKLMLSVAGAFFMLIHSVKLGGFYLSKQVVISSLFALLFTVICFVAVSYNGTTDYAYATYIVSMWVWYLASYVVITLISNFHQKINPRLIIDYLVGVCVMQCFFALLIEFVPIVKLLVDNYITIGVTDMLNDNDRLYGIGAALDVSGVRFSAVLIMIAVLITNAQSIKRNNWEIVLYFSAFIFIGFVGSLMSRTTSVGVGLALLYLVYKTDVLKLKIKIANFKLWQVLFFILIIIVPIIVFLYNTSPEAYKLIRYGFEGFFTWVETGTWETGSTNKLKTMYVYPTEFKTWLIGDGLFDNPSGHGFYMDTDVGYLRFIFYCGLAGLSAFILFFMYLSISMFIEFKKIKHLFFLLFLLLIINWFKVSTDIFLVYALFLSIGSPYFYHKYSVDEIKDVT